LQDFGGQVASAYAKASADKLAYVRRKTKSPFLWRIGLSLNPKFLSKFHPPPELAPLYQKGNAITNVMKHLILILP